MGKITLIVEGTSVGTVANGGGIVLEKEVSEQDSARLIGAFAVMLQDRWVTERQEVNGNHVDIVREPFTPTAAQVIEQWWNDVIEESTAKVRDFEEKEAARLAQAQVAPLTVF